MMEKILQWFAPVGQYTLSKLLPMVLLTVLGIVAIQLAMNLLRKGLKKSKLEKAAHTLIRTAIQTVLYVLLALAIASGLGIDVTGIIAMASVLTLAISLAVQNALTNVIGGFTLLYTKPFHSGDYVDIGADSGTVTEIGMTYTKLLTPDNKMISIPNSIVVAGDIVNYSITGTRRVSIPVQVEYHVPPQKVIDALIQAGTVDNVLLDPPPAAVITDYGVSCINYSLRVWTKTDDFWDVTFLINQNILNIFAAQDIPLAHPHMNVHIQK